jgi:hypothetical protein
MDKNDWGRSGGLGGLPADGFKQSKLCNKLFAPYDDRCADGASGIGVDPGLVNNRNRFFFFLQNTAVVLWIRLASGKTRLSTLGARFSRPQEGTHKPSVVLHAAAAPYSKR